MVCDKCEKKLTKVICPEVKKSGGVKVPEDESTAASGKIKTATSRRLQRKSNPYAKKLCKSCKQGVSQQEHFYCQSCAYKFGICAMCGVKILDTSSYKQSSV